MSKTNVSQTKILIALKKAQSLLAKIIAMKEEGRYCMDIMQQNLAVIGLLKSINRELLEGHINSCFKTAVNSRDIARQRQMIDEILQLNKLSNR